MFRYLSYKNKLKGYPLQVGFDDSNAKLVYKKLGNNIGSAGRALGENIGLASTLCRGGPDLK